MLIKSSRMLLVALALMMATPSLGCLVVPSRRGHRHHRVKHRHHKAKHRRHKRHRRCRPSHYWDGYRCRHKGRGHGARKHDY